MKIAVIGIGGVGGYYGGLLARKYSASKEHEIVFVARGEHLAAIKKNGLKLSTPGEEFTAVPDVATDNTEDLGTFGLVLFCVKSYGLEKAAAQIKKNVGPKTVIIPLLNGVDIPERIKAILPGADVLGGLVYIGSSIVGPGHVKQGGGSGQLVFGPQDAAKVENYRPVEKLLRDAGIKADLVGDIDLALWTKYIFISSMAGLTSYFGKTFGEILDSIEGKLFLEGVLKEIEAVARAKKVGFPPDVVRQTMDKVAAFPHGTKTSLQRDFEKGSQTELEVITGYVLKTGRQLGVPTPLTEKIYRELSKREAK
ncbi:MAG: 2-dehydropantoate 2-reductase [Syntrophaceae bacterium]